jgi:hypothetical protein
MTGFIHFPRNATERTEPSTEKRRRRGRRPASACQPRGLSGWEQTTGDVALQAGIAREISPRGDSAARPNQMITLAFTARQRSGQLGAPCSPGQGPTLTIKGELLVICTGIKSSLRPVTPTGPMDGYRPWKAVPGWMSTSG